MHLRLRRVLAGVLSFALCASLVLVGAQVPGLASAEEAQQESQPEDQTWEFDLSKSPDLPTLEMNAGTWQDISIDATNGKFGPRKDGDTQVNPGTTLSFEVAESPAGATVTITPSGLTVNVVVTVNGNNVNYSTGSGNAVSFSVGPEGGTVKLSFTGQTYLKTMTLEYGEPPVEYPGTPEGVEATDAVWDLSEARVGEINGSTGDFGTLKVDATSGKFAPRPASGDCQVNAGTVIYVPVAASDEPVYLTISGTANGQTFKVDGQEYALGGRVVVDASTDRYIKVEVVGTDSAYPAMISVDYEADTSTYPGTPEGVEAADTVWDLSSDTSVTRPSTETGGSRVDFAGMRVDAIAGGKFVPRDGDTQVNAGTVIYVPVASDPLGATLRIEGNNYNNLTVTVDGSEASLGSDISLAATEAAYVKVSFTSDSGKGSCYLTSISVDYGSDSEYATHVVTVGPSGDYQTIGDALAANESSLSDRLVLSIEPGSYHERVVVDMPGVTFVNADGEDGDPVVIHESYYSSNNRDGDGHFLPLDDHDLGTDQCATVLVEASATGFSATGITFQNDYNVVDHTGEGEQTPAVAFNSKADKVTLRGCSFIGRQDTLYVQGAGNRVYAEGCYIEGTVDFIFGDADAFFTGCDVHMAAFAGRDTGYFTAANTKKGNVGLVFSGCTLTADPSYSVTDKDNKGVSLGRPWQNLCYVNEVIRPDGSSYYEDIDSSKPNEGDYANVSSAVTFIGCTMPDNLKDARWNLWTGKNEKGDTVPVTYEDSVRFTEISCLNADGTPVSYGEGSGVVLGICDNTMGVSEATAYYLAEMKIGQGGWVPDEITLPEVPSDPEVPVVPSGQEDPETPSTPSDTVTSDEPATSTDDGANGSSGSSTTAGAGSGTSAASGSSTTAGSSAGNASSSTSGSRSVATSLATDSATSETKQADEAATEDSEEDGDSATTSIDDDAVPMAAEAGSADESADSSSLPVVPIVIGVVGVATVVVAGAVISRRRVY